MPKSSRCAKHQPERASRQKSYAARSRHSQHIPIFGEVSALDLHVRIEPAPAPDTLTAPPQRRLNPLETGKEQAE
jgi:hypothetical protein